MGAVAWARALFGGGNPAVANQWAGVAQTGNQDQIAPAPGAFAWPMMGPGQQQLVHPVMPNTGAIGNMVGRWGGVQTLGPSQVIVQQSNPNYTPITGIRNIYGPGFANVPSQSASPGTNPQYAGAPYSLAPKAALSPELVGVLSGFKQ